MIKTKKMIAILLIICLIILAIIVIMLKFIKSETDELSGLYDLPVEENSIYETELNKNLDLVQSENDFFTLEKQIKNFFLYYNAENKNAIYDVLDIQYISNNNMTMENCIEEIAKIYKESANNYSQEIAYFRESRAKPIYYIKGIIQYRSEMSG